MLSQNPNPPRPKKPPTGRPLGRPTKLTAAISQAILNAVAGGVPYVRAAALAGVTRETALSWLARGQGTGGQKVSAYFATFFDALSRAKAQDEARRVLRINQAGQGGAVIYEKTITHADGHVTTEVRRTPPDWQADSWHLERSQPDVWGRRERLDLRITMIQQAAEKIAAELGMTPEEVIAEGEALLRELDNA